MKQIKMPFINDITYYFIFINRDFTRKNSPKPYIALSFFLLYFIFQHFTLSLT